MQNPAATPSAVKLKTLSKLARFFKPYKLRLILAMIVLIIAAASALALPMAIKQIVDQGFFLNQPEVINRYFVILLAIATVMAMASAARFYLVMWLGERVVADIRTALYAHLLSLDPLFYETTATGEVLSRLTTDTTQVQSAAGSGLSVTLRCSILLLGSLVMLVLTSVKLTGLIVMIVPLVFIPLIVFGRKVKRLSRLTQDCIAESSALAGETLTAIQLIQAYVLEDYCKQRFDASISKGFNTAQQRLRARSFLSAVVIFIVFAAIIGGVWLGTQFVRSGQLTVGQLSQFILYAMMVASNTAMLSEVWGDMQRAAGALERILQLFALSPSLPVVQDPQPIKNAASSAIHFKDLTFHYPSRPQQAALDQFSLSIAPGESIALVGPSGAGKSTVLQLLLRFYDPQQGSIAIGATNIAAASFTALRQAIGIVPQETVIFAASVLDNIRLGSLDASEAEVMAAAKTAAADEFIQRLPEGYATHLGERGIRLSGGQRQRIAIARAILKNPPILLLDEATSALDAENERLVQEAIELLMQNRTTLVIAHRLATVLKADRIIVMDHGKIIGMGKHHELLQSNPLYAKLAALQFGELSSLMVEAQPNVVSYAP